MKRKFNFGQKILKFFSHDLWDLEFANLSKIRKTIMYFLKGGYLVFLGFIKDQCLLRASALTYTTTLSIVPLLAVAFSVSKGFGFQNTVYLKTFLTKIAAGRTQIVDQIISYINNTNVTALGAIGVATLLFTVISLLGNIEKALNRIWGIQRSRSIGRKFTDYLSVIIVYPLLTVIAISSTAGLQSNTIVQKILSVSVISHLYLFLLRLTPYIMVWLALTFVYYFMPNTRVKFTSALTGGIIGGTLWQVAQFFYIHFQVGVAKYNAIYGSFSQIPLFLIWLYISWVVVLLGAEISFAAQNLGTYQKEASSVNISMSDKERFALRIMLLISKSFYNSETFLNNESISTGLNLPVKLVNEILGILEKSGLVVAVKKEGGIYFTPGKPLEKINVYDVIKTLRDHGETQLKMSGDREYTFINELVGKIEKSTQTVVRGLSLKKFLS
ncbi:MAG: YihY family inner membrane protein [Spirochaetes bacterium]|nr:YihY family inner membrane protein [Spirochaetota bacterium]